MPLLGSELITGFFLKNDFTCMILLLFFLSLLLDEIILSISFNFPLIEREFERENYFVFQGNRRKKEKGNEKGTIRDAYNYFPAIEKRARVSCIDTFSQLSRIEVTW